MYQLIKPSQVELQSCCTLSNLYMFVKEIDFALTSELGALLRGHYRLTCRQRQTPSIRIHVGIRLSHETQHPASLLRGSRIFHMHGEKDPKSLVGTLLRFVGTLETRRI